MSQTTNRKKWNDILRLLKKGIRHLFLHTGGFKLLAVVISVLLWAGLISQDPNVTRNKTFQNVKISVLGSSSLSSRRYIVTSNLEELTSGITVTASVPQLQYENADASAYNLRIDLSGIRSAGEQELKILSSDNATYGEVVSITPSTVKVKVEDSFTYPNVPVSVETKGEVPDGWYISRPTSPVEEIQVSGPASIVKEVASAIVTLDLDALKWEERNVRTIGEIKLYNQNSEEITSSLLTITSGGSSIERVLVEASIMPTRDFSLSEMIQIKGEPAEGYERVGEPRISPEYITIAGEGKKLDELKNLPAGELAAKLLESAVVDVTDMTEQEKPELLKVKTLTAARDKAIVIKPDDGQVMVTVEIAPVSDETSAEEEAPEEGSMTEESAGETEETGDGGSGTDKPETDSLQQGS